MNCAILITARLKSKRLKRKVLKKINGRPMLSHLIDRLRLAKKCNNIFLITSTYSDDDELVSFCRNENIDIFRGDPDDVLERIRSAAMHFNIETIISCTADNPLIEPLYIDKMIDFHLRNKFEYTFSKGLPIGSYTYILDTNAVSRACQIKKTKDTEVWGEYFTKTNLFKLGCFNVHDLNPTLPKLRLTVDTIEDFKFVNEIFIHLGKNDNIFNLQDIINLCKKKPNLLKINSHIAQKDHKPISI